MPHLPIDVDGMRKLETIARGLALDARLLIGGAVLLWDGVWRTKQDVADGLTLDACFGPCPKLRAALISRGFLEQVGDDSFRVRGAARWLFGMGGRSRGGQAAKGNLRRGNQPGSAGKPAEDVPGSFPGEPGAQPGALPGSIPGSAPALLPNTQHPNTDSKAEATAPPPKRCDPPPKRKPKRAKPPPPAPKASGETPEALQALWNATASPDLPRWRSLEDDRLLAAQAGLARMTLDEWAEVIARISASDFLCGRIRDKDFRAGPDWLLTPGNADKVLEGMYDNAKKRGQASLRLDPDRPLKHCTVCPGTAIGSVWGDTGLCAKHYAEWMQAAESQGPGDMVAFTEAFVAERQHAGLGAA